MYQASKVSDHVYVSWVPILPLSIICPSDYGTVRTAWYILFTFYHSHIAFTENRKPCNSK